MQRRKTYLLNTGGDVLPEGRPEEDVVLSGAVDGARRYVAHAHARLQEVVDGGGGLSARLVQLQRRRLLLQPLEPLQLLLAQERVELARLQHTTHLLS